MPKLVFTISMSLDGYVAGPNVTPEQGLGEEGERLHEWVVGLKKWRESHGKPGGEAGPDNQIIEEMQQPAAVIMGRGMFSAGHGPWEDDPNRNGWWGDEPPFEKPVFILTHHARESQEMKGGTTFNFVTDGIESALEQARAAAGDGDVLVAGGASVADQYLKAGLLDEIQLSVVPLLLGGGVRLFDQLGTGPVELERIRVLDSPGVTHLKYRVLK